MMQRDVISWMQAYYQRAKAAGNRDQIQLPVLASKIAEAIDNNPQQALYLLKNAFALAGEFGEPCWTVIYHALQLQIYVYRLIDLPNGIQTAVEAIVALRGGEYQQCPGLDSIYTDLVTAYLYIDPYGYRDKILEALDYIEQNFKLDVATQVDVKLRRALVGIGCEDYETAHQFGLEALALGGDNLETYVILSHIAHYRGDLRAALEYTRLGEKYPLSPGLKNDLQMVQLLGYQAVYLLKLGDINNAESVRSHAYRILKKTQSEPLVSFYEATSVFHEEKQEYEPAIDQAHHLIEAAERHGSIYAGCSGRLLLCRLLGKAGQPMESAIAETYDSFKRLIDPSPMLIKLRRIEDDDFSST